MLREGRGAGPLSASWTGARRALLYSRRCCDSNRENGEEEDEMLFRRRGFLSLPMVIGAVVIGVVSGKAIFGPPLEEYWTKKNKQVIKEGDEGKSLVASK